MRRWGTRWMFIPSRTSTPSPFLATSGGLPLQSPRTLSCSLFSLPMPLLPSDTLWGILWGVPRVIYLLLAACRCGRVSTHQGALGTQGCPGHSVQGHQSPEGGIAEIVMVRLLLLGNLALLDLSHVDFHSLRKEKFSSASHFATPTATCWTFLT